MKPKRIILVRHGESTGNVDKAIYKTTQDHALGLTENGVEQAIKAGRQIKQLIGDQTVHFWVSPYNRTRQTFHNILQAFTTQQVTSAFEHLGVREQDWGHGVSRDPELTKQFEAERDWYGTTFYRLPTGESVADVWDRMGNFIDSMYRDFDDPEFKAENVVIVTHGRTLRVFCARFFHWSVEYMEALANPKNCEIWTLGTRMEGDKHRYYLVNTPRLYDDRQGVEPIPDLLKEFRQGKKLSLPTGSPHPSMESDPVAAPAPAHPAPADQDHGSVQLPVLQT